MSDFDYPRYLLIRDCVYTSSNVFIVAIFLGDFVLMINPLNITIYFKITNKTPLSTIKAPPIKISEVGYISPSIMPNIVAKSITE